MIHHYSAIQVIHQDIGNDVFRTGFGNKNVNVGIQFKDQVAQQQSVKRREVTNRQTMPRSFVKMLNSLVDIVDHS